MMNKIPMIIRFEQKPPPSLNDVIIIMFEENGGFNLWGNPIILGPTKVHVYGCDRQIWEPLWLEITGIEIIAIGSSESYLRLLKNIREYFGTNVKAWIGMEEIIDE